MPSNIKRDIPKFKEGDKVLYRSLKKVDVPGTIKNQSWEPSTGRVLYSVVVDDWFGDGPRSILCYEEHVQPRQLSLFGDSQMKFLLSKKAAWLEKSRDMYRVELTKPVGKDRKKVLGPAPTHIPNTYTELPKDGAEGGKSKPRYLQGDTVMISMGPTGQAPAKVRSFVWSNEQQAYYYRVEVGGPGEGAHEIGLWEIQLQPAQGRLFAMNVTAGKCQMCGASYQGEGPCPRCKYTPTRKPFFGKREGAQVLPFDPSKRKPKGPTPGVKEIPFPHSELPDELQEERDAVFYAYDNMIKDMKGLFNNLMAIGESDLAYKLSAAHHVLTGSTLGQ